MGRVSIQKVSGVKRFLITGLPRSRTAWLANFLTFGQAFCFHDGLQHCREIGDLENLFWNAGAEVVGDSDSGLLYVAEALPHLFPDVPLVLVERDPRQALESARKFFAANAYPGVKMGGSMVPMFERGVAGMNWLREHWMGPLLMVSYEELERLETCRKVWDFCMQGVMGFDVKHVRRWEMLHQMRVNVIPQKVSLENVKHLIK